eukprot:9913257-Lingulodinium_polyedra.AAC.1
MDGGLNVGPGIGAEVALVLGRRWWPRVLCPPPQSMARGGEPRATRQAERGRARARVRGRARASP